MFYQVIDRIFVIFLQDRRGQPGAERPCRRQVGPSDHLGIDVHDMLHGSTAHQDIFHRLAGEGELRSGGYSISGSVCGCVVSDFERDTLRTVYQYAVPSGRQEERGRFRGSPEAHAGIFVPDIVRSAVSYDRTRHLAETVDALAFAECQLLADIGVAVSVGDVCHAAKFCCGEETAGVIK